MNKHPHIHKKTDSQTASEPQQSQFQSRPFVVQAQPDSNKRLTKTEIENQEFQQQNLEATRLKIQAKHGVITPEGKERLNELQTKRSEFVQRKLDNAKHYGHNILEHLKPQDPARAETAPSVHSNPFSQKAEKSSQETFIDQTATSLRVQPFSNRLPRPLVQPKLTIGEPGDKYEQEADRVAAQVVNSINAPTPQQSEPDRAVQRQEEREAEIQAKPSISDIQRREAIGSGEASTDLESAIHSARGGGQPLDTGLQRSMGQAMGADFSRVKVHTDAKADRLNRSIQARAFTTGQDVFFRQGEYNPGSRGGQELIAHELTHVVQQSGGNVQRGTHQGKAKRVQRMFGNNPARTNLTHQPKNEYKVDRDMCIDVMDELSLSATVKIATDLGEAWRDGRAIIRDFPHAGGPDSRLHITVKVTSGRGAGTYHVPVVFERPGQLVLDDPTGDGITK